MNDFADRRGAQTVAKIAVVLKGAFSDAERSEVISFDTKWAKPSQRALNPFLLLRSLESLNSI